MKKALDTKELNIFPKLNQTNLLFPRKNMFFFNYD